jgi:uncharacterized beta-barrel protein YwiB (DUF1934 family)
MERFDIILNVRGSHVEDGEEDSLELLTEGLLTRQDDTYVIEYDESEMSGMENTRTRVILEGDKVWLQRTGATESRFEFNRSQRYEAVYETPYGPLQMSIMPTRVRSDITDSGGRIGLEYVIQVGGQSALNKLDIKYKMKN